MNALSLRVEHGNHIIVESYTFSLNYLRLEIPLVYHSHIFGEAFVEFPVRNTSAAQVANSHAKIFIYLLLPLLFW